MGTLSTLNVSRGDIKLSFDTHDSKEANRAKNMIEEMMRKGYAILVKQGEDYVRAKRFNKKTGEYIIASDPEPQAKTDATVPPQKRGSSERSIPMATAHTTAIAPTAGG